MTKALVGNGRQWEHGDWHVVLTCCHRRNAAGRFHLAYGPPSSASGMGPRLVLKEAEQVPPSATEVRKTCELSNGIYNH